MTGVDPGNPGAGVSVQTAPQGSQGNAAAGGAVRGAARGALIGNIADEDASDYALAGAVIGSVRGARRREQANMQAQAQAEERMETFKKAFTACIEGRGYTVSDSQRINPSLPNARASAREASSIVASIDALSNDVDSTLQTLVSFSTL
jgi:hypothetical protein